MFTYQLPTKIVFAQPALQALISELAELNADRILLVSDPGLERLGLVSGSEQALSRWSKHFPRWRPTPPPTAFTTPWLG
jgi:alcohol dehydrogenase class IV